MIEKALQYLVGLGKAEIHGEDGQRYSDKRLHLIPNAVADSFKVHTLAGLVDYINSEIDGNEELIVHIVSPTQVKIKSALNDNKNRDYFVDGEALIPTFHYDNFYDSEQFNIKLQSCFVQNDDRDVMLKVVGNIKEDMVKNFGDDGVSQSVVAKASVTSVENVIVPNPVKLAPYRTFPEVEQPTSEFIFRMKSGPACAIFEADGGKWKLEAIDNIRDYFERSLVEDIKKGRVHILA